MSDTAPLIDETAADPEREAATKAAVLNAAERLFALHGFQNVSVRDITAEAGVNLASVNYHFGSKDALLFEIFRRRTAELNRERARMLHEAADRHGGKPPVREILRRPVRAAAALVARPITSGASACSSSSAPAARAPRPMREVLRTDVSHLRRFADALIGALPDLPPEDVYWRLHFVLGMTHNNRFAEFDRLHALSDGLTRESDVDALLQTHAGFRRGGISGVKRRLDN